MTENARRSPADRVNRRTVMKLAGSGAGIAVAPTTGAAGRGSRRQYAGLSYDTRTHLPQRPATATLSFTSGDQLYGTLNVAGFQLQFARDDALPPRTSFGALTRYPFTKAEGRYRADGRRLQGVITTDGKRIVGHLSRPGPEYARLSYSLNRLDKGGSAKHIRGALTEFDPEEFAREPTVPETGVPTDTSIVNLKRGNFDG